MAAGPVIRANNGMARKLMSNCIFKQKADIKLRSSQELIKEKEETTT
jgi:hypothetical protein